MILRISQKLGKKTYGVEKLQDQMGAIDKIPLEDQVKMLMETLKDTSEQITGFEDLIETT